MDMDRHPLAYLRWQRHWSMDDLARLLRAQAAACGLRSGIDRNRIWRWEHGTTPDGDSQLLLARLLDVPATVIAQLRWPLWLPVFEQPVAFSPSGSRAALREVQVNRMDRRSFLVFSSSALVDLAANWARIEPRHLCHALDGRGIDAELLSWLEQRASELNAMPCGPGSPVPALIDAHLDTAIELIAQDRCTLPQGRRLHAVAGALAHRAGWLRFDADRHADAQRHWQAAVHAAHQAGDRDLAAVALSDLAYQATWLARPSDALRVLEHASSRTRTPAVRSLLAVRRARACAVLQDRSGTTHALASAQDELEQMRMESTPAVISWMSVADVNADAGRCWLDLGDPDSASTAIGTGLVELDPRRARTKAVFLTYRAEGALYRHDAAAAAADARTALDTALETGAARCIDHVSALIARLDQRSERPIVELREYAHARLT
ncbi:hypothetical protein [Streptomyces sp. NPDC001205]